MADAGLLIVLVVHVVAMGLATVAVTAADVLAVSGTRTIEPGRAFGNGLPDVSGIVGAVGVAHDSDTVTDVGVFVVVFATDVGATLHISCTGTTEEENLNRFFRVKETPDRCQIVL